MSSRDRGCAERVSARLNNPNPQPQQRIPSVARWSLSAVDGQRLSDAHLCSAGLATISPWWVG